MVSSTWMDTMATGFHGLPTYYIYSLSLSLSLDLWFVYVYVNVYIYICVNHVCIYIFFFWKTGLQTEFVYESFCGL